MTMGYFNVGQPKSDTSISKTQHTTMSGINAKWNNQQEDSTIKKESSFTAYLKKTSWQVDLQENYLVLSSDFTKVRNVASHSGMKNTSHLIK